MVALPWLQAQLHAIFQPDVQQTVETENDVSLAAPMIGGISGRVLHHSNADVAECLRSPKRQSALARMLTRSHLRPISDRHRESHHFHEPRIFLNPKPLPVAA